MIGVDTNFLVRIYLEDHPEQIKVAQDFLLECSAKGQLFISSYVIQEFVWILNKNGYTRGEVYDAVTALTDSAGITIGQKTVVLTALEKYRSGKADFADYMILAEGAQCGAHKLKTFDKKFQKELGQWHV